VLSETAGGDTAVDLLVRNAAVSEHALRRLLDPD
jgi:hypothetical protein